MGGKVENAAPMEGAEEGEPAEEQLNLKSSVVEHCGNQLLSHDACLAEEPAVTEQDCAVQAENESLTRRAPVEPGNPEKEVKHLPIHANDKFSAS